MLKITHTTGLTLHEKITRIIGIPYFISWNSTKSLWEFSSRRIIFTAFLVCLVWMLALPACYAVLATSIYYPGSYKTYKVMSTIVFMQIIHLTVASDVYIQLHGAPLVQGLNWLRELETQLNRYKLNYGTPTSYQTPTKSSRYSSIDFVGLVIIYIVISYTIYGTTFALGNIIFGLDAVYLIGLQWKPRLKISMYFQIFRYIATIIVCQLTALNNRAVTIVVIDLCHAGVSCIKKMTNLPTKFSYQHVQFYKQQFICCRYFEEFTKPLAFVFLSIIFVTLVSCTVHVIVSAKTSANLLMLFLSAFVAVSVFLLTLVICYCGSYFLEGTNQLINYQWKLQVGQNGYYRRLLGGCLPYAIKVGSVGVMNRDLLMGFLDAVLGNVVNVLMGIDEYF